MAIEKTIFTGTNQAQNFPEVYAWLTANAAEYFDEIVQNETLDTINCKIGGQDALILSFAANTPLVRVILKTGQDWKANGFTLWFEFACKTNSGIYLKAKNSLMDLIVTRDNMGSVAFASIISYVDKSQYKFLVGSFENSNNFLYPEDVFTKLNNLPFIFSTPSTALTPIPCRGRSYLTDVQFVPFTEYPGLNGRIISGGMEYYYNGIFALKG